MAETDREILRKLNRDAEKQRKDQDGLMQSSAKLQENMPSLLHGETEILQKAAMHACMHQ